MVLLDDDRVFWSKRIEEHMLFIYLYVYDIQVRREAEQLYNQWKQAHALDDLSLISLMGDTLEFQNQTHVLLNSGEWIGSFFPAWMEHITEELEYATDKVARNDISDEDELLFWDDVVKDHSSLDVRMIDPSETTAINVARSIQDDTSHILDSYDVFRDTSTLLDMSLGNIMEIIKFHEDAKRDPPKSIIHPILLNHVYEEEKRGRLIMNIIRNRK